MPGPRAVAVGFACLLAALLASPGDATKIRVSSVGELHAALLNGDVSEVEVVPNARPGAWNFSTAYWPSQVLERVVTVVTVSGKDGRGAQPPHLDVSRLTELVVVRAPGSLVPVLPLLCFAAGADNGSIVVLGGAACTHVAQSPATGWPLRSAYWATWRTDWSQLDDRTVRVEDTGEISSVPHGVHWRTLDTTPRCARDEAPGGGGARPSDAQLMAAMAATLLASLAVLYYGLNHNVVYVSREESPEVAVARSKGIILQALIGQGTFGHVYRGLYLGQTVAIKVIEFPTFERRAAAQVARECAHALACCHPSIVECLHHCTVTVRTQLGRGLAQAAPAAREQELAYADEELMRAHAAQQQAQQQAQGQAPAAGQPSTASAPHQPATAPLAGAAAAAALPRRGPAAAGPPSPSSASLGPEGAVRHPAARSTASTCSTASTSSSTSSSASVEGFMALLVMEHCSLGSVHRAIAAGRFFQDRRGRVPNLDWVCRTARDVAQGLAYLHDSLHIVHRDVSTNNVLLAPDASDPRGFRARLSDFGLSTVLRNCQTHKTSQLKGTVDFMAPEIFVSGEIRFAVDIYALGIMVYWMCKGEGPFTGMAPFQVVGRKLEELHTRRLLLLPATMPADLRRLVWDCCHHDPRQRPSAAQVADRLTHIIQKQAEERTRQQSMAV